MVFSLVHDVANGAVRSRQKCGLSKAKTSVPFRGHKRAMLRFRRMRSLQKCASLHGSIYNNSIRMACCQCQSDMLLLGWVSDELSLLKPLHEHAASGRAISPDGYSDSA
jgi:hypothetical protein